MHTLGDSRGLQLLSKKGGEGRGGEGRGGEVPPGVRIVIVSAHVGFSVFSTVDVSPFCSASVWSVAVGGGCGSSPSSGQSSLKRQQTGEIGALADAVLMPTSIAYKQNANTHHKHVCVHVLCTHNNARYETLNDVVYNTQRLCCHVSTTTHATSKTNITLL